MLLFLSTGLAPNEQVSMSTLLSPPRRPTAACPDGFQPAAAHVLCSEQELRRAGQAARTAVARDTRPNWGLLSDWITPALLGLQLQTTTNIPTTLERKS